MCEINVSLEIKYIENYNAITIICNKFIEQDKKLSIKLLKYIAECLNVFLNK